MAEPLDKSMTQEAILLEKLSRIEENASGYFAVHVHLSRLRPSNRQPHFINIAARAFDPLIASADAVLYSMMNQDLILVCREILVEDIDPETLREKSPNKLIPPLHGALLKNEQDVALFERLAFLSRREGSPRRGPAG